ncbi:hypothetical protein TNCV_2872581 [Trichonephila clavipes]|nr:hypothetical protein TNCV_2872581 [Trichonephila clavipes]
MEWTFLYPPPLTSLDPVHKRPVLDGYRPLKRTSKNLELLSKAPNQLSKTSTLPELLLTDRRPQHTAE